ncbi:MAG: rod shape-determining protein MreC [Candidatus Sericytochromatia bacterium]|nr:rod shape-determining protein MreC [Candidatus Sericytochromatia bacterium]
MPISSRFRKKRWWRPLIWQGAAVLGVIWAFWAIQHSGYPQAALRGIVGAMSRVSSTFTSLGLNLSGHFTTSDENSRLRRQIEQFTWQMQSFEHVIAENQRLRKLVNAKLPPAHRHLTAVVIGRSPDTWHAQVLVNAGKADGVMLDVAALSAEGLVGRVIQVADHASTVQLITDPQCAISCLDVRSGAFGVIAGRYNGEAEFTYLKQNADVKKGDLLSTSGYGVFPKGIPVGLVRRVKRVASRINPEIEVDLMGDVDNLQELVLALPTGEAVVAPPP